MDTVDRIFELVDSKYREQQEFAKAIGVPPSVVSEWRRRKSASYTKPERIAKIAVLLGTTMEYLLTGKKKDPVIVSDDEAALDQELITRLCQLTPEELLKVDAFVEGLLAAR